MQRQIRTTALTCLIGIAALAGCATMGGTRDPVTAGIAKKLLMKGQTTQQEVVTWLGAPNIVTKGPGDRGEMWTYQKIAYEATGTSGGLGVAGVGAGGGWGGGLLGSVGGYHDRSGQRTVTLIIVFDEQERVQDYSVMETHF